MFYALLILFVLLFAFVDVWYIARFVVIALKTRFNRRDTQKQPYTVDELTRVFQTRGMVLPSDLDAFLHMNNSKYFKEFDLSRISMAAEIGFLEVLKKHGGIFVVGAGSISYKKAMKLFQRYLIKTRIVCWDERAFYVQQEMLTAAGRVAASMDCKIAMKGITTDTFIREFCGEVLPSPEPTQAISSWRDTLTTMKSVATEGEGEEGSNYCSQRKRRRSITSLER